MPSASGTKHSERFQVPDAETWLQAGLLLRRYARLNRAIRMADHFGDRPDRPADCQARRATGH